jgi:hypothetical protein
VTSPSDPANGLRRMNDGLTFVRQHPEMFRQLAHDGPSRRRPFARMRDGLRSSMLTVGIWSCQISIGSRTSKTAIRS